MMVLALTACMSTSLLMAADTADNTKQYVGEVTSVIPYDSGVSLMLVKGLGVGFHVKSSTSFTGFQRSMVSTDARQLTLVLKGTKVQFTVQRTDMGTMDVITMKPYVPGQSNSKIVFIGRAKPLTGPTKEEVKLPPKEQDTSAGTTEPAPWMPEIPQAPQVPVIPTPSGN